MRALLISSALIIFINSCKNRNDAHSSFETRGLEWHNPYQIFDEPNSQEIEKMKFYMLAVYRGFLDSMIILSIRQDSTAIEGFYKKIPYEQLQTLYSNLTDTSSFEFSSMRFQPNISIIDSINSILKRNDFFSLKDTIQTGGNDGAMKDLIVYNGKEVYIKVRVYGGEKSLESRFANSFNDIMGLKPPKPIPFYLR